MEYDLVNRPHHHPLFEEIEFKEDAVAVCSRCRLPLSPPAYSCSDSDCNFHIHQSCLHLPSYIRTTFHPQDPLLLLDYCIPFCCDACGRSPPGQVYYSNHYQLDIKCAIGDTKASGFWMSGKYLHFTHPHPLTLSLSPSLEQQQNKLVTKKVFACVLCQLPIKSGSPSSYYFCPQCDCENAHFYLHEECAKQSRELRNPVYHPHPLYLTHIRPVMSNKSVCNSCRNPCIGFVYNCVQCKFTLHVACLQSFNHIHTTDVLRSKISFKCRVCGKKSDDTFPWICNICHILIHKKCAEFPLRLRITEHTGHVLTFTYDYPPDADNVILCKLCGDRVNTKYASYSCSECNNYFSHLECAERSCAHSQSMPADVDAAAVAVSDLRLSTITNDKLGDEKIMIQHFSHPHFLTPFFPTSKVAKEEVGCEGCMKCLSVSGLSYRCHNQYCDFFLHEECAKLPTTKILPRLHPHPLTLVSIQDFISQCEACLQYFQGFAYYCKKCMSTIDIRCASIEIPFNHPNHQHPLYLYDIQVHPINGSEDCGACGKKVTEELVAFGCIKCQIYFHIGCATLPVVVRYRFDPHPLYLTFVEKERIEDYYCDICEEVREPGIWIYSCRECKFEAHPSCALGEFPYVKSAMHKSHRHPLSLVMMEEGGGVCAACNKSCAHNFVFQCGACNFNVHAIGPCYNLQILHANLSFTNRNVFSRATQSYDNPIQKRPIGVTLTLGPFGLTYTNRQGGGRQWKERLLFSTISKFVVYHSQRICCIQIQHAKSTGELEWSKHGPEDGQKTEVSFDYPNEYLVSIHGSHEREIITSLTLQTNIETYRPIGTEGEVSFSSFKEGVKIIGIFGTCSDFGIHSIGFYGVSTQDQ